MSESEWGTDLPFAPVPMWVAELPISDRALRLYTLLAGMRDYGSGKASYGRKLLAKKLRCSDDSLDRAKAELEKYEAISVERGEASGGAIPRNVYTVHRIPPANRTRAATPIAAGERLLDTRTGAATNEKILNEKSSPSRRTGRAPTQVSGKRVTGEEEAFAVAVLDVFNEISGRKFGSKETLGKIVLRHREHPDLTVEDHRRIIAEQFAHPWWQGDPAPAVIYGNGSLFDRARNNVRGNGNNDVGDDQKRYTTD